MSDVHLSMILGNSNGSTRMQRLRSRSRLSFLAQFHSPFLPDNQSHIPYHEESEKEPPMGHIQSWPMLDSCVQDEWHQRSNSQPILLEGFPEKLQTSFERAEHPTIRTSHPNLYNAMARSNSDPAVGCCAPPFVFPTRYIAKRIPPTP